MDNENAPKRRRRITLDDCRIDWKHYPVGEEDGSISYVIISDEEKEKMRDEDCGYCIEARVRRSTCIDYFEFEYDKLKIKEYYKQLHYTEDNVAWMGLVDMFNDGWLKSAAYVKWDKGLTFCLDSRCIEYFLSEIKDPKIRVEILQLIVDHPTQVLDKLDWDDLPLYEYLLTIYTTDLHFHQQEKEDLNFLKYGVPVEGDNNAIRQYIEKKKRTDNEFKYFCNTHSFKEICERIEKELNININYNSLQRNINRNRKKGGKL